MGVDEEGLLAELAARADRSLRDLRAEEITERFLAIVGPHPQQLSADANAGREALREHRRPTPRQIQALEYAIRLLRPAPLLRNGRPGDLPDAVTRAAFPGWDAFADRVATQSSAIGRIGRSAPGAPDGDPVGTAFLIEPGLVVTNLHVLRKLSYGSGVLESGDAVVAFRVERQTVRDEPAAPVIKVLAIDDTLDLVLLRIDMKDLPPRDPLDVDPTPPATRDRVAAVGYPLDDRERNPMFVSALFGAGFGVLRAAPGDVIATAPGRFDHDCSTLGGNSGSPIFSLSTGRVVGVHCTGDYLYRNGAVDGEALRRFVDENRG